MSEQTPRASGQEEEQGTEAAQEEKQGLLSGFKEFLMRGNVVELAVAVVVGAAFSKIVDAVVQGFINPLVGAIGTQDLDEYRSCLQGPCTFDKSGELSEGIAISWGPVLSASLTFLMTAAVVYFLMILPMNKYKAHLAAKQPPEEPEPTEVELLKEIRDALVQQRGSSTAAPSTGTEIPRQQPGTDLQK